MMHSIPTRSVKHPAVLEHNRKTDVLADVKISPSYTFVQQLKEKACDGEL